MLLLAAAALLALGSAAADAAPQEVQLRSGRHYAFHAPTALSKDKAAPAVAVLAGNGADGAAVLTMQGWSGTADASGFIAIGLQAMPVDAKAPPQPMRNPRVWRNGSEAAGGGQSVDDVAHVAEAIADVARRHRIDPNRVYVVGFADGGDMAQRLVTDMPDRFAAAASVAGHLRVTARPALHVPLMLVYGGSDPMVPLRGGHAPSLGRADRRLPSVEETVNRWVNSLRCPAAPAASVDAPRVERRLWAPCAGGAELAVILVRDLGHHWPGSGGGLLPTRLAGPTSDALDATAAIWAFLKRHSRSTPAPQ